MDDNTDSTRRRRVTDCVAVSEQLFPSVRRMEVHEQPVVLVDATSPQAALSLCVLHSSFGACFFRCWRGRVCCGLF